MSKTYKLKDHIISFVTAMIMVFTMIPWQPVTAYAAEQEAGINSDCVHTGINSDFS